MLREIFSQVANTRFREVLEPRQPGCAGFYAWRALRGRNGRGYGTIGQISIRRDVLPGCH